MRKTWSQRALDKEKDLKRAVQKVKRTKKTVCAAKMKVCVKRRIGKRVILRLEVTG